MQVPRPCGAAALSTTAFDVVSPGRGRAGDVAPDAGPSGTLATGAGAGNLAATATTPPRPGLSGLGRIALRPLHQLEGGIEHGGASPPLTDHALGHQTGAGFDPGDPRPALEDEEQTSGPVAQHALEVRGPRAGLDPHRLHSSGHPDPLARLHRGDGRGRPSPLGQRLVGGQHRPRPPVPLPPARTVGPATPVGVDPCRSVATRIAEARPLHRAAVGPHPLAEAPTHGEGDDGGAHVRHLAQHRSDLVGRAVVQEALPDPGVAAPG